MDIFGFKLFTQKPSKLETFASDAIRGGDGATVLDSGVGGGGAAAYYFDLVEVPKDEKEQIKTYRSISGSSEIDSALTEIKNEMFIFDVPDKKAIEIDFFDNDEISKSLKDKITEEFKRLYSILDFDNKGTDIFNRFYVDGRLFAHKVVDSAKLKNGIQKIVFIDPLEIKKITKIPQTDVNGIYDVSQIKNTYIFAPNKDDMTPANAAQKLSQKALEISEDAITYLDSGIYDTETKKPLGFLHKTIIPYNNMKLMEESLVIYRVVRSPERRAIYVDVGNLPKTKAEAYMKELMNGFRNKMVYDSKTGSIADRRNVLSMLEDYWLPRRNGTGTEIDTLPGAQNLGTISDVEYFRNKLFSSLNVPSSRFSSENQPASPFVFGRSTEIDREEYRFKKFINRLRNKFNYLFEDLLHTQLILKKIIVEDDWELIKNNLQFVYTEDNAFVEFKEAEILNSKLGILSQVDAFTGKYFSTLWVQKNVLKLADEEIDRENEQIQKEKPPEPEEPEPPAEEQPTNQEEEQS